MEEVLTAFARIAREKISSRIANRDLFDDSAWFALTCKDLMGNQGCSLRADVHLTAPPYFDSHNESHWTACDAGLRAFLAWFEPYFLAVARELLDGAVIKTGITTFRTVDFGRDLIAKGSPTRMRMHVCCV